MFLFQKIEETMMKYNDARHAVGEFILKEPEKLYTYTVAEIAERTYTSKATVVRFAQAMGYIGWKEFMKDYIAEMQYQKTHNHEIDFNFPFNENDDVVNIIEKIKKLQIDSIKDTAILLDVDMLNKAKQYLLQAENIVIFGSSPNLYLGELFKRKLITVGKKVSVASFGETGIMAAAMGSKDCAVIISYSGNNPTRDPVNKVITLKNNKVPIIGITSGGDNYMRKNLDCILTMSSRERLYTKISNFSTEESVNFILNVLFSCFFAVNYKRNLNFKILNSRTLEYERNTMVKELHDNE